MNTENKITKPSKFLLYTDAVRALMELASSRVFHSVRKYEKNGDGHPVLVIPGFLGSDTSTKYLRDFINELGYNAYEWGLDRNLADFDDLEFLILKIDNLFGKYNQKVSVIGWSLGGVYARQLAKAKKDRVRQVITLGSPFNGANAPNNIRWLFDNVKEWRGTAGLDDELIADLPIPAPVPTTAIYSKEDGVVPWEVCIEKEEDELHQNVQVRGSHLGLGTNPSVFHIIANRLQYEEENWEPFEPSDTWGGRFFFPED